MIVGMSVLNLPLPVGDFGTLLKSPPLPDVGSDTTLGDFTYGVAMITLSYASRIAP